MQNFRPLGALEVSNSYNGVVRELGRELGREGGRDILCVV